MTTISELTEYVQEKAKAYLDEGGDSIETFPLSIVDFVIEYAMSCCHFPSQYTEEMKVADLEKSKVSLAMACNDIYSKMGAEGQTSSVENSVSRAYDSAWITPSLLSGLPNYVKVF